MSVQTTNVLFDKARSLKSAELEKLILLFLWRWKLATTAILHAHFFADKSLSAAYQRLWWLEREGLIRTHCDRAQTRYVWALETKGFRLIKDFLPPLREHGYKSENLGHDFLVSAVHLGGCVGSSSTRLECFSEQELRRVSHDYFPQWVPREEAHRPDGYWHAPFGEKKRTIALEVELSRQSHERYRSIGNIYDRHKEIVYVLWIVRSMNAARGIHSLVSPRLTGVQEYHAFATVGDFCTLGWDAKIIHGALTGSSVASLVTGESRTLAEPVLGVFSLDMRKTPHKSKTCVPFSDYGFRL